MEYDIQKEESWKRKERIKERKTERKKGRKKKVELA